MTNLMPPENPPVGIIQACHDVLRLIGECFPLLSYKKVLVCSEVMTKTQWTLYEGKRGWNLYVVSDQEPSPNLLENLKFRMMFEDYLQKSNVVWRHERGATAMIFPQVIRLSQEDYLEGCTRIA